MSSSNKPDVNDYDYNWYDNAVPTVLSKVVIPPCDPTADEKLYHVSIAAISLVVMLILALMNFRKTACHRSMAGLLGPVNFLDHTQHKGLVAAVFGVLFCELCMVVLAQNPLPFTTDQDHREYWKILSLFYYPVLYYPLLACGTLRSQVGYVLGTLLSWAHFGVLVWQKVDCPRTPEIYTFYSLLLSLPHIACLAFLSVQYPLLLVKGKNGSVRTCASEDLDNSYYTDYVKEVLRKKPLKNSPSRSTLPRLSERLLDALKSYVYTPEKVFRFPLKLAVSAVICFIAVYQVALLLVAAVVPTLHKVRAGVNEDIAYLLAGFNIVLSQDRAEVVRIVVYYMWCVEACYISAVTLSCLVTLVMLMRSMVLHRSNLKGLYRGDVYTVYNRLRSIRPSRPALVCWMGFTSYQAGLICLGMIIQTLVFFICVTFAVFLVIVPILYGHNLILFRILKNMWPFWVTLVLVVLAQHVASKFAFIRKDAETRVLDNRSSLFLLDYLLFSVNILVGVVVGVWRVVVTGLYNIIHMGRMDMSLLNRGVEPFDAGYRCYSHYLKIEVSQSHPVMKAFCGMLLRSMEQEGSAGQKMRDAEEGIQLVQQERKVNKTSKGRRARARWQLLFTLMNNQSLVASRKHLQRQDSEGFLNGNLCPATGEDAEKETQKS